MISYDHSYQDLKLALESQANPEYATAMKAYMKGQYEFYGLKSEARRTVQKTYVKEWQSLDSRAFKSLIQQCWSEPQRDWQYIAIDAVRKYLKHMDESYIDFIMSLISEKSWWDTVDLLATNVIGPLLIRYPNGKDDYISAWINSGDMWVERTAIIHQLKYKDQMDADLLSALIDIKKHDKRFFIQKAIGWALRQMGRFDPRAVLDILELHPELSHLAKREAKKYLDVS